MPDDTKSKIAELEKELYAKDFKVEHDDQFIPQTRPEVVPAQDWNKAEEAAQFSRDILHTTERQENIKKMTKKILIGSVAFFVVAASVAGYVWWKGSNIISGENISIDVVAPLAVTGGEPFTSKFTIANNNKASIEEATIYLEYQSGFYNAETKTELPRTSEKLGQILSGQVATYSTNTILYGEENSQRDVQIVLEYRMTGSNAILKKTSSYTVKISSSPINIKLDVLKEVSSGQQVEFAINLESNSSDPMDNLLMEASYPLGFTFKSADPAPHYGTTVWNLGSLAPQEKRVIKVRGVVSGQEGSEGITKVSIGVKSPRDDRTLGVVYNSVSESTLITKPSFAISLSVNGEQAPEYSVVLGKGVRVDVLWQNNNPTKVTDGVIEVAIKGDLLNRYSIYAGGGGFYRSIDDTIVWNKSGSPDLRSMDAGAKGSFSFSFSPITTGADTGRIVKNPQINLSAKATVRGTSESGSTGDIVTYLTRNIKIETTLSLTTKGLHFSGPFQNTGPMPPKAEKETTYTIVWNVRNTSNNVSNVLVKTSLPIYVKWLGKISPQSENLSYQTDGAQVTWNVGAIPSGGSREVAFQISLLPSLSQINQFPSLTGDTTLSGFDDFAKTGLSDQKTGIRTLLTGDPQFVQSQGAVVQ